MSRSIKKNPVVKAQDKEQKTISNRTIRRKNKERLSNNLDEDTLLTTPSGGQFKKEYNSWNITDLIFRTTKEEAIQNYEKRSSLDFYLNFTHDEAFAKSILDEFMQRYPTLERYLNEWEKHTIRK